ncbi:MAG TPA: hypothetical protein VLT36_11485 [Candidatus Dormibacteraeota bacterium]|nr:hypothetical protein [Candidatus Dormibacteraeota bacterium]
MSNSVDNVANETFSYDALMIHAWLNSLLEEAREVYASRKNPRFFGLQTGQAQRGFLRIFGNPKDADLHRLIQNMYRFTTCSDPYAVILFRALDALALEHDNQGDFDGHRGPDFSEFSKRPREAVRWMRESMDRWLEWVDAFIHMQTHAQWHLAPECFETESLRHNAAALAASEHRLEQFRSARTTGWETSHSDTTRFFRELPLWQILPQATISKPQRPWPHPELDDAIITLWPLVKRHYWSYADLRNVLSDLQDCSDACICESDRNLAIYCLHTLRLRKIGHGKTARRERPIGYTVAIKLCPPVTPAPSLAFSEAIPFTDSTDALRAQLAQPGFQA